jgi:hypothetical protein
MPMFRVLGKSAEQEHFERRIAGLNVFVQERLSSLLVWDRFLGFTMNQEALLRVSSQELLSVLRDYHGFVYVPEGLRDAVVLRNVPEGHLTPSEVWAGEDDDSDR